MLITHKDIKNVCYYIPTILQAYIWNATCSHQNMTDFQSRKNLYSITMNAVSYNENIS